MPAPELLSLTFASPEENLACDEAMLEHAEASEHPGFLRFFESASCFVVLGYAKRLAEEVFEEECARLGIPILRRCSGGGTVLQGPGCFNYSLVLPIGAMPGLETITGANRVIMERNRACLAAVLGQAVKVEGCSDLTIDGVKFSGNAQRRKKRCLLYHGSILRAFDLPLIGQVLREPAQQPDYRRRRAHEGFLRNAAAGAETLARELAAAWNERGPAGETTAAEIAAATGELARGKYATDEWNRKS